MSVLSAVILAACRASCCKSVVKRTLTPQRHLVRYSRRDPWRATNSEPLVVQSGQWYAVHETTERPILYDLSVRGGRLQASHKARTVHTEQLWSLTCDMTNLRSRVLIKTSRTDGQNDDRTREADWARWQPGQGHDGTDSGSSANTQQGVRGTCGRPCSRIFLLL